MGFFDEIRKVIFGAKSVTKSAAGKAMDKGKEIGGDALDKMGDVGSELKDQAENVWDKAVDSTEGLGEIVKEKTGDVFETAKEFVEDIGEKVLDTGGDILDKGKEIAEGIGEKVLDKTEDVVNQVKDVAGDLGEKISDVGQGSDSVENIAADLTDTGSDLKDGIKTSAAAGVVGSSANRIVESTKDIAENIGEKVLDAKADMLDKAKELTGNLGEKLDETLEKAERLNAQEAAAPEYKEQSEILGKDLLEDKDDFFAKADAFADGRYEEVTDALSSEPKITRIEEVVEEVESAADPLPGFEDLDGDGSEIVDDAIIDEDDVEELT